MSKPMDYRQTEQDLKDGIEKLLLHDEDCTIPSPTGCSCGALLVRMNVFSLAKRYSDQRELKALSLVKEKYKKLEHGIFAIDFYINKPYPDDTRWTPYTRFIHPRMIMVQKALEGEGVGELWAMGESKRLAELKQKQASKEDTV
jgi:hypothetical protein